MPERILEFDAYTDDTAPGYGWSLTTAYTTLLSVGLVVLTVLAIRFLDDSAVGVALAQFQGSGIRDVAVSSLSVLGIFVLVAVGRYAGVRGVDSGSLVAAAGGTLVTFATTVASGLLFVEVVATYVRPRFYLGLAVVFGGMVLAANVFVLAMDRDLSDWSEYLWLMLVVLFVYGILMAWVWDNSANGLWWELFKLLRSGLFLVLIPATLFTFYVHDAYRNAERGLGATHNALATYVAVTSLVLVPIELVYVFVSGDDSDSSASTA